MAKRVKLKNLFSRTSKKSKFSYISLCTIVILGSILGYFLTKPLPSQAAWYSESWAYRKKLTIDHTKVIGGPLLNFPILVSLTDTDLRKAQTNGYDILFTDNTGNGTKLDHEIEKFDSTTGTLVAWVRIASLSSATDTTIYMYYGNPTVPDQQNKTGVWTEGYTMVYHLGEAAGTTGADSVNDSTTTTSGTPSTGIAFGQSGKVGDATDFSAGTGINIGTLGSPPLTATSTISFWINTHNYASPPRQNPFDQAYGGWGTMTLEPTDYINWYMGSNGGNTTPYNSYASSNIGGNDTWIYITAVRNPSGPYTYTYYYNGTNPTGSSYDSTYPVINSRTFTIGDGYVNPLNGLLDEFRVSNTTRSTGWVTTEYNTMNSPTTFFTKAKEEKGRGPVLYYAFNEGHDTTTYSTTPNSNNATITNATWQTEDLCVNGKCLYFNGTNAVVSTATVIPNIQTVSFWVKPKTTTQSLLNLDGGSHTISANSGTITAAGFTSYYVNGTASAPLVANVWQHIEAVDTTAFDTSTITIGQISAAYLDGFIDEFKLYDYVRSTNQIKQDYVSRGTIAGVSTQFGGQQESLSDGLVGYWRMNETSWTKDASNTVLDASGNGNNATPTCRGASCTIAGITTGKFGNGGNFDGTDDWINAGNNTSLHMDQNKSMTFAGWIRINDLPVGGTNKIFRYDDCDDADGDAPTTRNLYHLGVYSSDGSTGALSFYFGPSASLSSLTSDYLITEGVWYHIAAVRNTTNKTIELYINGQLNKTGPDTTTGTWETTGQYLMLGRYYSSGGIWYNGQMDEMRIYNKALSNSDIQKLSTWAESPAGYWKMDDKVSGDNKTLVDSSGLGHNGTTYDGNDNTGMNCNISGKFGSGCQMDGHDDYIQVNNSTDFLLDDTNNFSAMLWVYSYGWGSNTVGLLGKRGTVYANRDWVLAYNTGGSDIGIWLGETGTEDFIETGQALSINTWHHVAFTKEGTTYKIYINGVIQEDTTSTATWVNSENLALGNGDTTGTWGINGLIDDVKIYNYARTPQQIIEDMNAGHPAPGSPIGSPLLYMKYDEGNQDIIHNSGNGGSNLDATRAGGTNQPTWTTDGKIGNSISFDGNDYATIGNKSELKTDNKTITFWAKPSSITAASPVISSSNANWYVGFGAGSNRMLTSHTVAAGTQQTSYGPNNSAILNEWNYYAYTFDVSGNNVNISFYRNGTFLETDSYTTGYGTNYGSNFILGAFTTSSYYLNGLIDELKVYTSVLTLDQIKTDYNLGKAVVFGSNTDSTGQSGDLSATRSYCIPGDDTSCSAPVSQWHFDENANTTINDSSGNNHTATMQGTTTNIWNSGKIGSAGRFNGTNNFATFTSYTLPSLHTVEFWVNWQDSDDAIIIGQNSVGYYAAYIDATNIYYSCELNEYVTVAHGGLTTNQWYHFAVVRSGNTAVQFYKNGVQIGTTQNIPVDRSLTLNTIGAFGDGSYPFQGLIDEMMIYGYARTPAQIAWDYNQGAPIAHYRLDECTGSTAYNSALNSNGTAAGMNGTIVPNTGRTTGNSCGSGVSTEMRELNGKYNGGLIFDGTGDAVSINPDPQLNLNSGGTIAAWIYPHSAGENSYGRIVDKSSDTAGTGGFSLHMSGNTIMAEIDNHNQSSTTNSIPYNVWSHVVWTFDGTYWRFYINGTLNYFNNISYLPGTTSLGMTIGNRQGATDRTFDGQIDDVRIYNYALTAQQVKTLYNGDAAAHF